MPLAPLVSCLKITLHLLLTELLGYHANVRLITFYLLVSGQEEIMLQDLVGAPDEFEMLDLVHPLVWIGESSK